MSRRPFECPIYGELGGCPQEKHCKREYMKTGHFLVTIHHKYWPKADYKTPVEKKFRELTENKEPLCPEAHQNLHRSERAPRKPSRDQMVEAVRRYVQSAPKRSV